MLIFSSFTLFGELNYNENIYSAKQRVRLAFLLGAEKRLGFRFM